MSGTRSVPFGKDLPPPLVPLPSCRARVKQLQAKLFNDVPLSTSYIANCRLCLGNNFGEQSTTVIEEQFCTMLQLVFPFPILNEIGLPMNVCTDCYKSVQIFYGYSYQVQINQQKLQESFLKAEYMDYTDMNNGMLERAVTNREEYQTIVRESRHVRGIESQENYENVFLIDTAQYKTEDDEAYQGQDPLSHSSYYDEKSLRVAAKVGTVSASKTPKDNMKDGIHFTQSKVTPNGSINNDKNAESLSIELSSGRRKAHYSSAESRRKTLEQNATDHANRLGPNPLYICSTCNQTFDENYQFICHQKTHLMKECPICNQSIQYALLAKHVIQEHADRDRREKNVK